MPIVFHESTGATNRRFTSYDRSATTGLDYAVNRHYDAQQGRFTQVDPIGISAASLSNPQSLNLYAYCGGDPINHTDPSGLFLGLGSLFAAVADAFSSIGDFFGGGGGGGFFGFFGEFLMIAGGSLFQVIVPAVFVAYFYRQSQFYAAALTLFWVGESLLNVSVYAGDAVAMGLPLLGGQDSVHDWNYMLDHLGMLNNTSEIAGLIRLIGTSLIIAAICLAIRNSRSETAQLSENE